MNESQREEFEAFMAERFPNSIDRRRCKNGDGNDYMSSDMGIARIVWQHMQQKLNAVVAENVALKKLQPTLEMLLAAHKELEDYDNINLDDDAVVFLWQAMRGQQKTPTTESILSAVRAEGAEQASLRIRNLLSAIKDQHHGVVNECADVAQDVASQLRADAAKDGE